MFQHVVDGGLAVAMHLNARRVMLPTFVGPHDPQPGFDEEPEKPPKSPVTRWDMPRGVQCRLCWSANTSGSGAGGGGATSVTHASKSFSSCVVHLFFQRGAVLLGAPRRSGAHGVDTVVGAPPLRPH